MVDPVTLEIIRGAIRAAQAEMDALLERTAISAFIREKKDFYTAVFDYGYLDMSSEGFTYALINLPGTSGEMAGVGGIGVPQHEGTPPHWMSYLTVKLADDSLTSMSAGRAFSRRALLYSHPDGGLRPQREATRWNGGHFWPVPQQW